MSKLYARIIGTGGYLPERVVTNDDLAKIVDTDHDWIVQRTGIHARRFAAPHQTTSDLATHAASQAIENAGLKPSDIDLIVLATATPDYTFPATATLVQHKLGCKSGLAFDIAAVCCGYLVALQTADNFLKSGQAKTALVIGAETMSRILDMSDRRSCVLFGDGAAAVVLRAEEQDSAQPRGILGTYTQSDGTYSSILQTTGGPSFNQTTGTIYMEGQEVFKHAVQKLHQSAIDTLAKHQLEKDDIDWFIPHQANIRIIHAIADKLSLAPEKVITTVDQHANTSAASIPLALYSAVSQNKIKPGDLILHEAIGGGLVWGSALVRY